LPDIKGRLVLDRIARGAHRRVIGELAAAPAAVERLHVSSKAFVEPEIVPVRGRQLVGEPFVRELVVEQPVITGRRLLIFVAIGVDRLVLHSEVRRLDDPHLLIAERIRPDQGLEEIQCRREFLGKSRRLLLVPLEMPPLDRDDVAILAAIAALHELVRPYVQCDPVSVRVLDAPMIGASAVRLRRDALEHPVGRCGQPRRNGDSDVHHRRLAERMIDARPEEVAAFALHGGGDPWLAACRRCPDEAAVPRRTHRHARRAAVVDLDGEAAALRDRAGERDRKPPLGICPAAHLERSSVDRDGGYRQVAVEIDHDPSDGTSGGEAVRGDAGDLLAIRKDFDGEVGAVELQRRLLGDHLAPGALGLIGQLRLALFRGGGRCDREHGGECGNGGCFHRQSLLTRPPYREGPCGRQAQKRCGLMAGRPPLI
jgi:hypothetical protein